MDKEDKSHQNGFARPTNGAELDDAVLVNRWRDLGNRAFSSKAEEDDFYRRHPEYVRYRQIAELRSPVDDLVPATKDVADTANAEAAVNRAVDAAKNALGAFNRCADAYQACAGSCAFTKDPAACIAARCRECASEENAVIAAGHEVERRQTMFQSASQNEYTNFSRAIEAAGTAVVPLPAKPQQGVAVFQPRPSPTPSRVSEPVKPAAGVAVFQTKSVAIPVGAAFSAPPTRNWLGAGVAVFSTRTPIPVGGSNSAAPSAYTTQPGTLESTTTQRSGRNWGALLRGLQFGLSIYDGIQASRQPTQGVSPPPKITTGLGVSGVPSAAPVVPPPSKVPQRSAQPAPPSPAMCQNPAALANPHNVTQDGRNVIGSTAPSNYAPLYVPCSQLNK